MPRFSRITERDVLGGQRWVVRGVTGWTPGEAGKGVFREPWDTDVSVGAGGGARGG